MNMRVFAPPRVFRGNRPSLFRFAGLCVIVAALSAHAATIPNPSFEANTFTGTISSNGNTPITGWTANNTTLVGLDSTSGGIFADNGIVPNGTRVAFLRSVGGNTTLSTTISGLVAGSHYLLQFRYNRKTGSQGVDPDFSVLLNGGIIPRPAFNAVESAGFHSASYGIATIPFVATGPTASLVIGYTTTVDSTLLVDNFTVVAAAPIVVTNVNNGGPGSLRQALASAAATPAFNVITFAPALSDQTITLLGKITIIDSSGVAVDAFALSKGITINGGNAGFGLFSVNSPAHFRGLTLTGGAGTGGGAIEVNNFATVAVSRCTLVGNGSAATTFGGALLNNGNSTALVSQCTFTGNFSNANGGAIHTTVNCITVLDQCTLSGNSATTAGGAINNNGKVVTRNSIVAGNAAPTGADIQSSGANARLIRVGANIFQGVNDTAGGATTTGPAPTIADPLLDPALLADNGGPTKTIGLQPASPARNVSVGSPYAFDQRGKPVQGLAPDIGAFDVQRGTFVVGPGGTIAENGDSRVVTISRVNGFEGSVGVKVSPVAGTASADDFQNNFVTFGFGDGVPSFNFVVGSSNQPPIVEPNETFTVVLSNPTGGASIGTPSSATIIIIDPSSGSSAADGADPPAPVITAPAASIVLNTNGTITATGTATDNKGVNAVNVTFIIDGVFQASFPALLTSQHATSTGWTASFSAGFPMNQVNILALTFDDAGRGSPTATRTVNVAMPLAVRIAGNGSVTPGFAPTSFRQVGLYQTITATPAAGQFFTGWTFSGATAGEIGVLGGDLERQTLAFIHRKNLVLTANFIPSPFSTITGNYKGLIQPAANPSISNEGLFTATVTPTGAFSGSMKIDSLVLNFAGVFDSSGFARFGTGRATSLRLTRVGKPSLVLSFHLLPVGGPFVATVTGNVVALDFRNVPVDSSTFFANRTSFDGITQLAPGYLLGPGNTNQVYNVVFQALPIAFQPAALAQESFYPQGFGFGRITLTKAGVVTLTDCTLADGTTGVTASTYLSIALTAPLFIPLYGNKGYLLATLVFDTSQPISDIATGNAHWCRPFLNTHYYPAGWPEVLVVQCFGAKFGVTAGQSVLRMAGNPSTPLLAPDVDGNAQLIFQKGQLASTLTKTANFSTADVITKVPVNDPTFTLSLTRSTGLFTGTFRHTDTNTLPIKGIILQKGTFAGGFGFFLTKQPVPIDYSGESGSVEILGQP